MSLQVQSNLHELTIILTITTVLTIPYLNFQVRSNLRELFLHDVSPTLDSEQLEPLRWEQMKRVQTKFEVQKAERPSQAAQVRIQKIKIKQTNHRNTSLNPSESSALPRGSKPTWVLLLPQTIDNHQHQASSNKTWQAATVGDQAYSLSNQTLLIKIQK